MLWVLLIIAIFVFGPMIDRYFEDISKIRDRLDGDTPPPGIPLIPDDYIPPSDR